MLMVGKLDRCEREKDFKPTTQALASLRQEQGRQNCKIPKKERTRRRPFDEELQATLEWLSQDWRTYLAHSSSSSSSSKNWWQHEHEHQDSQWRGYQETQWRDHQWQDHQWQDHDWSGVSVRSRKLSARSTDQQDCQWKDQKW